MLAQLGDDGLERGHVLVGGQRRVRRNQSLEAPHQQQRVAEAGSHAPLPAAPIPAAVLAAIPAAAGVWRGWEGVEARRGVHLFIPPGGPRGRPAVRQERLGQRPHTAPVALARLRSMVEKAGRQAGRQKGNAREERGRG